MSTNFNEILSASKAELVRAWCVEQAENITGYGASGADVINIASMLEEYVSSGETESTISAAVMEGLREGRLEVLELCREISPRTASDLEGKFEIRGWVVNS